LDHDAQVSESPAAGDRGGFGHHVRRIGLVAGPFAALAVYFVLPTEFVDVTGKVVLFLHSGRATVAMLTWMALWWMTEAVEIEVTSLLPIVAFPLAGIMSIEEAAAPYASSLVFLFLGGFILALGIRRCGLDRRIAFLTLRGVGTTPSRLVGGMLAITAFLSLWISNTAAASMMVPVAVAVVDLVLRTRTGRGFDPKVGITAESVDERHFATALVLAIAYGASVGGVATLVGSPPNAFAARFIQQNFGVEISVMKWFTIGLPVTILFLLVVWFVLVRVAFRSRLGAVEGGREFVAAELRKLGPLWRAERAVLAVCAVTICLWITRQWVVAIELGAMQPFAGLTDAGIAMTAALALFLVPVPGSPGGRAMDWGYATQLPWGVLLLFGGGLSLATATETTGVAAFVGSQTDALGGLPELVVLVALITIVTLGSEVASNTALIALILPLLAAAAPGLGVPPALLLIAATLAANVAFMMPVGTPPNAIVFGTGLVRIPQMVRAGTILNVLWIVFLTGYAYFVIGPLYTGGR
jgi:sodium-dependent dicarboxylate transporter 2/3/5